MKLVYDINLGIHAVAGIIALASLTVPLLSKKGGRVHRRAGWVFTLAMAIIAVTGLGLALAWIVDPLGVKPLDPGATPEQIAGAERTYRALGVFFVTVGVMSGASVWYGISAVRLRKPMPAARRRWFVLCDYAAWILTGLAGLALLVPGLRYTQPLFLAFAALALVNAVLDGRAVLRPAEDKQAWLIRHLQSMLGGATVAITAFSALVLRRYIDPDGGLALSYWVIPIALGTAATVLWTRAYRK